MVDYISNKIETIRKLFYFRVYLNILRLKATILYYITPETKKYDVVIIDDSVPKYHSGFRDYEFSGFLREYKNIALFSIIGSKVSMLRQYAYYHIQTTKAWKKSKAEFVKENKINPDSIRPFHSWTKVNAKLAYCVFMTNGVYLIDYLEKRKLKFILELYPGGGFSILTEGFMYDNLKKVIGSPYLEKVIVNQAVSREFLLEQNLCDKSKIVYIHGGFVSADFMDLPSKTVHYPRDKKTIDVCWAGAKYMPKGVNKGYDIFIDMAHFLLDTAPEYNFHFHVVGGFDEFEIPIDPKHRPKFTYYGFLKNKEFTEFYKDKDIFICPLRPNLLGKGVFDGFPTGVSGEAGLHGICLLLSDPLNQNEVFKDGYDSFFLENDPIQYANKVLELAKDPEQIYIVGDRSRITMQKKYDHKNQFDQRFALVNEFLEKNK